MKNTAESGINVKIWPSEYQSSGLSRYEKRFMNCSLSVNKYGFLMLKIDPSMVEDEKMHCLVINEGVIFFKFFDNIFYASDFEVVLDFAKDVFKKIKNNILGRLWANKLLTVDGQTLKFPVNVVYVFPKLAKKSVITTFPQYVHIPFVEKRCLFYEGFSELLHDFDTVIKHLLKSPITPVKEPMVINDSNADSIMHRIAPQYFTSRQRQKEEQAFSPGVDRKLLVIDRNDKIAEVCQLEPEQINIVNRISKTDPNQLILACAGSGKSVLLMSKCFKAAQENPNKKFLITCKNTNLRSLYMWNIERAGLPVNNIECLTFHALCKKLLKNNGFTVSSGNYDTWVSSAIDNLYAGKIHDRYYGIFIDEVQSFEPEWYKFCFDLLENKDGKDHIFVICGDKTQRLEKLKKRGQAPWQVGDGYPSYRGGNKNIRIEINYRNCIEVNEYINRFISASKQYLKSIQEDEEIDPDMFLTGKASRHGYNVTYEEVPLKNVTCEVDMIIQKIKSISEENDIPLNEIAIIMYKGTYKYPIKGWLDENYSLQYELESRLRDEGIPFCKLYSSDESRQDRYGEKGGVKLVKFQSTLGLDYRAAIVCGLLPLGEFEKVKNPNWDILKRDKEKYDYAIEATQTCIKNLYVACTRAKDILHIIASEDEYSSVFMWMLKQAI